MRLTDLEPMPRVLIADDQADIRLALQLLLKGQGYRTATADSPAAVLEGVSRGYDVLLMDLNYARDTTSGAEGLDLIPRVRTIDPALRVVVMTAWGTIDLAVEAMRRGAHDFVLKPWDNASLVRAVKSQQAARETDARGAGAFAAHDMSVAHRVQDRLLPQGTPRLATLEYAGQCLQAGPVGGDAYDFLDLAPGRLGLLLADASGRGVSAALLMAHLQASLRSHLAGGCADMTSLLRSVNRLFYSSTAPEHFATLFFGCYDDAGRRLRYVNCGQVPPFLLRTDGSCERLAPCAPALGLIEDWDGQPREAELAAGDTLLLFSDGVSDATGSEGEELGEARLEAALRAAGRLPLPMLLSSILETVQGFVGASHEDDATLVVARAL
jgi:sigma-B regulation protein RsbU (phosphoserine phosphatase)